MNGSVILHLLNPSPQRIDHVCEYIANRQIRIISGYCTAYDTQKQCGFLLVKKTKIGSVDPVPYTNSQTLPF